MSDQGKVEKGSNDLFEGFSKLDRGERLNRLVKMGALEAEDLLYLKSGSPLDISLAEKFIENVIGYYPLPLGVAAHFVIDGRPVVIPMAVEETSIIAAASKTAKWIKEHGSISTEVVGKSIIGQIQLANVKNYSKFKATVLANKERYLASANKWVAKGLVQRGGGVREIRVRPIDRGQGETMAVVHVLADPCDAMGANIMNQICEYLKTPIEADTKETVTMCILSNLVDTKLTKATVTLNNIDEDLMDRIEEASYFAQRDPYRAATNNKGVLNGIDPILIATGNDWRAVEAGIHAYTSRNGKYESVTKWHREGKQLIGRFEAPVIVGIVGGVTQLHPSAKMALKMMKIKTSDELSRICAAVGLVLNLGALRALTTVGIIEGHMKLHIQNLTLGAGAEEKEIPQLQKRLEEILRLTKRISLGQAVEVLNELRGQGLSTTQDSKI